MEPVKAKEPAYLTPPESEGLINDRLPKDILGKIFYHIIMNANDRKEEQNEMRNMALVCRHWHDSRIFTVRVLCLIDNYLSIANTILDILPQGRAPEFRDSLQRDIEMITALEENAQLKPLLEQIEKTLRCFGQFPEFTTLPLSREFRGCYSFLKEYYYWILVEKLCSEGRIGTAIEVAKSRIPEEYYYWILVEKLCSEGRIGTVIEVAKSRIPEMGPLVCLAGLLFRFESGEESQYILTRTTAKGTGPFCLEWEKEKFIPKSINCPNEEKRLGDLEKVTEAFIALGEEGRSIICRLIEEENIKMPKFGPYIPNIFSNMFSPNTQIGIMRDSGLLSIYQLLRERGDSQALEKVHITSWGNCVLYDIAYEWMKNNRDDLAVQALNAITDDFFRLKRIKLLFAKFSEDKERLQRLADNLTGVGFIPDEQLREWIQQSIPEPKSCTFM